MQRIQLGAPYEEFIKKVIATGYYSTATEVIRDALRYKMGQMEQNRIDHIRSLVAEGEKSLEENQAVLVDKNFEVNLMENIDKKISEGYTIPPYLRPK